MFPFPWLLPGLALVLHATAEDACEAEADVSLLQLSMHLSGAEGPPLAPLPDVVQDAFEKVADDARAKLWYGSGDDATTPLNKDVFSAVDISLPLEVPVIRFSPKDPYDDGKKNIVGMSVLAKKPCLVYGIGVATASSGMTSEFETEMANMGCETHAFDCAVPPDDPNVKDKPFAFHQWCIGRPEETTGDAADSMAEGIYAKTGVANGTGMVFKPLSQTMHELNHTHLSLLKFDIEGFEWKLFSDELFNATDLPDQLSFELHTEGAHSYFVPPENVAGKSYREVNRLFLKLFDLGYRVSSKQVNAGDWACAEFILVKQ